MTIDIDELERVGSEWFPWTVREWRPNKWLVELQQFSEDAEVIAECCCKEDAEFIATARNNWPAIIAELREAERLRNLVAKIREKLEQIVETEGVDKGVIYVSNFSPLHFNHDLQCQVYDHENFSPLGDALIELHDLVKEPQ